MWSPVHRHSRPGCVSSAWAGHIHIVAGVEAPNQIPTGSIHRISRPDSPVIGFAEKEVFQCPLRIRITIGRINVIVCC